MNAMRVLAVTTAALVLVCLGCSAIYPPVAPIEETLQKSVGRRFSDWDRAGRSKWHVLTSDALHDELEYRWPNGCSAALSVRKPDDIIFGWRLTSDPAPCRERVVYTGA